MPFTFAHPAAALPLRKLTPKYLDMTALAIGCITPDMPAFSPLLFLFSHVHSFQQSYNRGLILGWVLLGAYYLLRVPLCQLLPSPHREALLPLAQKKIWLTPWRIVVISASLILGQWTHLLWDSFTHVQGYFVQAIPSYAQAFVTVAGYKVPAYYICQVVSSAVGLLAIGIVYYQWLKKQPRVFAPIEMEGWRYAFWMAAFIIPLPFAVPYGVHFVRYIQGYNLVRLFLINGVMRYLAIFLPILFLACVVMLVLGQRRDESKTEMESA